MRELAVVLAIICLSLVLCGETALAQDTSKPEESVVRGVIPRGSCMTTDAIRASPFRYVIVFEDVRYDEDDKGNPTVPDGRFVEVLMEARAFNEPNLVYLFTCLSNWLSAPIDLDIRVHTSLMTIETADERLQMSTHTSRDRFSEYYPQAFYTRGPTWSEESLDHPEGVIDGCDSGFLFWTGKPGRLKNKFVTLPCTLKK